MGGLRYGWFGQMGDMSGRLSTKVHAVNVGNNPICGARLGLGRVFQNCGRQEHIECRNCIRVINARKNN